MDSGQFLGTAGKLGMAGLAMAALPLHAQEQDTQMWVYAVAKTDLGDDTALTIDFTQRWREERRGDEQRTARVTVLHEVTDGVRLGGGGGVFETARGRTELRPHQEIDLAFGRFSARTRVEQRFFDGADRMEVRVRQLVRYTHPFGGGVKLALDGEYLGIAQSRTRAGNRPRNQWRARAILTAKVSDALSLGGGYMAIHTPIKGQGDQLTHVPEAYITLRF
ncbi:MAG: DUF2490 domain-containing protein [Erythrobacter sp.]|nr:DUF2490 domain-containing protein [Erythrobacter sp.]